MATADKKVYTKGKFLYLGSEKFYIKGVTYGTFKPQENGDLFPDALTVEKDFDLMSRHHINCIRTYTPPPRCLLDLAVRYGLKVMVGLSWEQHITFLDSAKRKKDIIQKVRDAVLSCGQHPAILCYAIGNEIPASMVRWYGKRKIETFLRQLYLAAKQSDPGCLVTYVNFPTTEYLDLSFLDFYCFNVYLESREKLSAYLSRLHNIAGEKPLVLAEIGLDSMRNGSLKQAEVLQWQIQTVFAKGGAGMFVFAWTDQWWRGGFEIEDWDFGIVDRERNPKPALYSVHRSMQDVPLAIHEALPLISVVICSYNGSATIRDSLNALQRLAYPNFEVIVVNDGSTDQLAEIVAEYPVKLVTTGNNGLSGARNVGSKNSRGEIIAYLDDDAYPDPHWLNYLADAFQNTKHAGIGGPNIPPPEDGTIATCVANSPGGPVQVLLSDEIAEHIPGCNMSFRKDILEEIGGFDPVFRTAGDDVDICWRLQKAGYTLGFHPSAVVWHHRRNSISAYWNQQKGYGKAEALLESKWPEKYNGFGHLAWLGRLYGNGILCPLKYKSDKIFHGTWGTALFQSLYQPADGFIQAIPLMPEWYLLSATLALLASLGLVWSPLLFFWPVFLSCIALLIIQACNSAVKKVIHLPADKKNLKYAFVIMWLHLIQPVARLHGRIRFGLTPWRKRGIVANAKYLFTFRSLVFSHWSEQWHSSEDWLRAIEKNLLALKTRLKRGGDFDAWDIQARSGLFGKSRCLLTIEEHGKGKQYLRLKCWKVPCIAALLIISLLSALTILSALDEAWIVSCLMGSVALSFTLRFLSESASSIHNIVLAGELLSEYDKKPDYETESIGDEDLRSLNEAVKEAQEEVVLEVNMQ